MKVNKYQRFWNWFRVKNKILFNFEEHQETMTQKLVSELHKIHPDLAFAFGPVVDGKREFVISGGGIHDAFPEVIELYKEAPEFEQWTITAFRPRTGTDLQVTIADITLSTDEIFFDFEEEEDKLGIILYSKHQLSEETMQILFLFLDNALGEYDVTTKIGSISFKLLDESLSDLLPFSELPNIVDSYFAKEERMVN